MGAVLLSMLTEQRSDRLKELRYNKNLTQRDVAAMLGISHGAYSGWEFHETRTIPAHFLRKLAEILETTPEFIQEGKVGSVVTEPVMRYTLNLTDVEDSDVVLKNLNDFDLLEIPYVPVKAYATFGENCFNDVKKGDLNSITILAKAIRKEDANRAIGIELKGRSMEPNYPENSIVVAYAIPRSKWHLAEGVCVFSLKGEVIIKRIAQNKLKKEGEMTLISDNPSYPGEKVITMEEIICIYEVGDFIYAPKR